MALPSTTANTPAALQKLLQWQEYTSRNSTLFANGLRLGLYKDLDSVDVPLGGWLEMNNWHTYNNRLEKYAGWKTLAAFSTGTGTVAFYAFSTQLNGSGTAFTTQLVVGSLITVRGNGGELITRKVTHITSDTVLTVNSLWGDASNSEAFLYLKPFPANLNYAFDFEDITRTFYFLLGTKTDLYTVDRTTFAATSIGSGYLGQDSDRWQSAVINNNVILVTVATSAPQVFDPASPSAVSDLGGVSPDAAQPAGAKFIINHLNHVVLAFTVESATTYNYRVRWSDIDVPTTWTPDVTANEAGFVDLDGEIRGIASLTTTSFLVYTLNSIYLFSYQGLPVIYSVQKIVNTVGIFAPYSLVASQDIHYFLGELGFYSFNGTGEPTLIGVKRVDNFLLADLYNGTPEAIVGFAHPNFPEIVFYYQGSASGGSFNKCITYNWLEDNWCRRDPFPFSVLAEFTLIQAKTFDQNTSDDTFNLATPSWRDKYVEGASVVIGGISFLNQLDNTNFQGDGQTPVVGTLQTGDLWPAGWQRKAHVSRVFFDILNINGQTQVKLGNRDKAGDPISFDNSYFLDSDCRLDAIVTARMFELQVVTPEICFLTDISVLFQIAGERV